MNHKQDHARQKISQYQLQIQSSIMKENQTPPISSYELNAVKHNDHN